MAHRPLDASCGPLLVDDDGTVIRARGIRYATAERFAAPVLVAPHRQLRDATTRGPACPQGPARLESVYGSAVEGLRHDEHCQVLTVTAPRDATHLPVMVWFHGGAYLSGSGEAPKSDPDALVRDGQVIVVSVSYRLGIFGYLNPVRDAEQNLGLRDQIAALRWIRQHITSFGGDPSRITIFGQSAGGDSVLALILSIGTEALFHRAIVQSAPLGLRTGRSAMTAAMLDTVDSALGETPAREAGVGQLLAAQTAAVATASRFGMVGSLPFAPIMGSDPLPASMDLSGGCRTTVARVEILVGHTGDDAAPFVAMDPRAQRLRRLGAPGRSVAKVVSTVMTARIFGCPARRLAQTWSAQGGRAATFRVDWSPPAAPLGACHCIELPLLFGAPQAWADAPMLGPTADPVDEGVARSARRYWAAFAHHGVEGLGGGALTI